MTKNKNKFLVNDIHSGLNETNVKNIFYPKSIMDIQKIIHEAREQRLPMSIAGGRHAMGGQQFTDSAILVDMKRMNKVINFDYSRATVEIGAGIQWPELVDYLLKIPLERHLKKGGSFYGR